MSVKKKMTKKRPRMTATNAVFAELESMSRAEQEKIAVQLLEWIQENELAP